MSQLWDVYLMEMGEFHKIGQAINAARRRITLDVGPLPLRLVHSFPSPDSIRDEKCLHKRYKAKLVRREWFRLDPPDVDEIRRILAGPIEPLPPAQPVQPSRGFVPSPALQKWLDESERKGHLAHRRLTDRARVMVDLSGLSVEIIAQRSSMSVGMLARFLIGQASLSPRQRESLATTLGVPSETLCRFYYLDK